jgi:hypothetical protein
LILGQGIQGQIKEILVFLMKQCVNCSVVMAGAVWPKCIPICNVIVRQRQHLAHIQQVRHTQPHTAPTVQEAPFRHLEKPQTWIHYYSVKFPSNFL